jgi:hydroxyacylglutathione hydrolase
MKEIPWISPGKKARIFGAGAPGIKDRKCTILSFDAPRSGACPDVRVSIDGEERVLRPWQLIDESFRSSHRCRSLAPGLKFFEWQGYENNGNSIVMESGSSRIIVDSGHFHLLGSLLVALDAEGVGLDSMKAALFTHCHPDHFDSAGLLYQAGIRIGLSPREKDYLAGDGGTLFRFFGADVPEITIDIPLEPGDAQIEGFAFSIFHTPGHSPGSVSLYWKEKKALCAGDVVFPGGAFGRCDFPGGSYRTLLDSFGAYDGLDIEFLLSGHGPAVSGAGEVKESIEDSRNNLRAVIFSPY